MGNPFKKILGFFKALGRRLGGALVSVGKHISEEQFDYALAIARAAVDRFTDNANRRTWAVHEVQTKFGLSESLARVAVELAVHSLKQGEQRLFEQLDEVLTPETESNWVGGEGAAAPVLPDGPSGEPLTEEEAAAVVESSPFPAGEDEAGGPADEGSVTGEANSEPAGSEPAGAAVADPAQVF